MAQKIKVLTNGNPECEHSFQRSEHPWDKGMLVFYYCMACFFHFCISLRERKLTKEEIYTLCQSPCNTEISL